MPRDKQKHLFAGLALSLLVGLLFTPFWGLTAAVVVGAGKEVMWDWALGRGTPEWWDFWVTVAGGVIGHLLLGLI